MLVATVKLLIYKRKKSFFDGNFCVAEIEGVPMYSFFISLNIGSTKEKNHFKLSILDNSKIVFKLFFGTPTKYKTQFQLLKTYSTKNAPKNLFLDRDTLNLLSILYRAV